MTAYAYILRCNDGSYYTGSTRDTVEARLAQHNAGTFNGFTSTRWPVVLLWAQDFSAVEDAIAAERQIKGWRREKKEALIMGDYDLLPRLASRARQDDTMLEDST